MVASADDRRYLVLSQPVARSESPQPPTEVQQVTAETMDFGPPVALPTCVFGQGDGEEKFPLRVILGLGIGERTGRGSSRRPAAPAPGR